MSNKIYYQSELDEGSQIKVLKPTKKEKPSNKGLPKKSRFVEGQKQKKETEEIELLKQKPAVRIQQLKNDLIILGHTLFQGKQINQSLFRKIQLLTYSKTTEAKLKESIDVLKNINNQVVSGASETRTTKNNNSNKFTAKEFQEIKKKKKDEDNITYNVFIKYEQTIERTGDDGKTEQTNVTYNHTLKVKGKDNIKDDIKDLIKFILANGYVIKVNILDVIVNKEIVQPDLYKFKEGESVYFKAWNATFNYHGYNLDINNETPFECVPNALYKMYGNDKTTKRDSFLRRIANGGLEYVMW